MIRYEYRVTRCSADEFNDVVYFCTPEGACGLERVPVDQMERVSDVLNNEGKMGWELVQIAFGKDGAIMFWKRGIPGFPGAAVA